MVTRQQWEARTHATGTIKELVRLTSTASGNPRFRVLLEGGGTVETQPDAAVADVVKNYAPGATGHGHVLMTLDHKGFLIGLRLAEFITDASQATIGDPVVSWSEAVRGTVSATTKTTITVDWGYPKTPGVPGSQFTQFLSGALASGSLFKVI